MENIGDMEMIDIEQILADAPRDIELYSVICGVVKLAGRGKTEETNEIMRIKTYTEDDGIFHWFNKYGQRSTRGECVLFPSRGHKSWEDWQSVLFRAGDISLCVRRLRIQRSRHQDNGRVGRDEICDEERSGVLQ